jgi:hypothetical protein
MAITAERKPWHASFRLLGTRRARFRGAAGRRDGRRPRGARVLSAAPRYRDIDLYWLVSCFAAYKVGIFALVTVNPRATRAYFIGPSRSISCWCSCCCASPAR